MKKLTLLLTLFFIGFLSALASPTDTINTVYKEGEFITVCTVFVNASDSLGTSVTKDFDYQMRYNLDALFTWALKGLNLRKEKNELMEFYFKTTKFNKETGVINGIGDVIIPDVITFPNISIDSKLSQKKYTNGKSSFDLDLVNSKGFINKMHCTFSLVPIKNKKCIFNLETHIRFGWFFNIFISEHRFKNIMEWRLKRYIHNLKDEAERRARLTPNR